MVVDEPLSRCSRLAVALDRRPLPVPGDALVSEGDVDDVRVVRRLARDDERLREREPHDPGLDVHPSNY